MATQTQQQVSVDAFKEAFSGVPMPVSVLTAARGGDPFGTTVSSFCSLSVNPPMVLAALDLASNTLPVIEETRRFALNILAHDQGEFARRCATKDVTKFDGLAWRLERGLPRLEGVASWLVCEVSHVFPGGDHAIVTGTVVDSEYMPSVPLIYHRREFCMPAGLP